MKKNFLFLLLILSMTVISVKADMTVEESTDAEYLINAGYSQITAEDVYMLKNRVNGKPIEPLYEQSSNKLVKCWRKFFSYLDPAQDAQDRLHHDVKMQPSFSDL